MKKIHKTLEMAIDGAVSMVKVRNNIQQTCLTEGNATPAIKNKYKTHFANRLTFILSIKHVFHTANKGRFVTVINGSGSILANIRRCVNTKKIPADLLLQK